MATTRANIESEIVRKLGTLITTVGGDGCTADGTNKTLGPPIGRTVRALGGTTTDPVAPSDAEILASGAAFDALVDVSMYYAAKDATTSATLLIDTRQGPIDQKLSQARSNLEGLLALLEGALLENGISVADPNDKQAFMAII